jgi:hypothetical protein
MFIKPLSLSSVPNTGTWQTWNEYFSRCSPENPNKPPAHLGPRCISSRRAPWKLQLEHNGFRIILKKKPRINQGKITSYLVCLEESFDKNIAPVELDWNRIATKYVLCQFFSWCSNFLRQDFLQTLFLSPKKYSLLLLKGAAKNSRLNLEIQKKLRCSNWLYEMACKIGWYF